MSIRSILRNKSRVQRKTPSPYTKGTTVNKLANIIVAKMLFYGKTFNEILKEDSIRRYIATHNMGELRWFPPNGKPGSLNELLKLAVGKKIGVVIP